VWLRSGDPHEAPAICFNYLQEEEDRVTFRAAVRLTREIFAQPAFDPWRGAEVLPGTEVTSDDEIDAWVAGHAETAYHPSCTCPMGVGPQAVVDPQLRVHGVEGLRVVDSSVMPVITNGNLNAPTIMIAEKASDLILGREPLASSNAAVGRAEDWETRQRPGLPVRSAPTPNQHPNGET
jgi:choline dehydrogenase